MDEATARPWRKDFSDGSGGGRYIVAGDHETVVVGGAPDSWGIEQGVLSSADAALIVEAVNAYDRLRAIEAAARWLVNIHSGAIEIPAESALAEDIDALRTALKVPSDAR